MEQVLRDQVTSQLDALSVHLKIARAVVPGVRDGLNVAKVTAFTDTISRIRAIAEQLAHAAGLNGNADQMTLDLERDEP
jgi:hypothetical protein